MIFLDPKIKIDIFISQTFFMGRKFKVNLAELLRVIFLQDNEEFAKTYNISKRKMKKIKASLRKGKWKISDT
jgi:hypothetical protein